MSISYRAMAEEGILKKKASMRRDPDEEVLFPAKYPMTSDIAWHALLGMTKSD